MAAGYATAGVSFHWRRDWRETTGDAVLTYLGTGVQGNVVGGVWDA